MRETHYPRYETNPAIHTWNKPISAFASKNNTYDYNPKVIEDIYKLLILGEKIDIEVVLHENGVL